MSTPKAEKGYAFGRWFGTIGFFLGVWLAIDWQLGWIGAIIIGLIGAAVGLWVERVVTRVLIFLLSLLYLLIRNGIIDAIFG